MTSNGGTRSGTSRRRFLQTTALTGAALGATRFAPATSGGDGEGAAGKKLNLLILGGTSFIGPHIVERALERGHSITLFNRGKTNPNIFPQLEKLQGNRDPQKGEGLAALEKKVKAGVRYDGVIDTSGHYPRWVRGSAELLRDNAGQYVYISSLSALASHAEPGMDETAPAAQLEDPTVETMGENYENYGGLKALCEKTATEVMDGRATCLRPGLIVGPRDNVPRFTWWPVRIERGGEVLAPGNHDDPVQYIDGRDLARFVVKAIEDQTMGLFHLNGPTSPTNIAEVLYGCKAVIGGDVTFTWVPADFLEQHQVQGWSHMPLWIPPKGDYRGFHRVDCSKAIAAGLTTRPLAETVRDTLEWYHAWPAKHPDKEFRWYGGIDPEREQKVIAAWKNRDKKKDA